MQDRKIHKGVRMPESIINWICKKTKESGRTFSAEVVYQLNVVINSGKRKERRNAKR